MFAHSALRTVFPAQSSLIGVKLCVGTLSKLVIFDFEIITMKASQEWNKFKLFPSVVYYNTSFTTFLLYFLIFCNSLIGKNKILSYLRIVNQKIIFYYYFLWFVFKLFIDKINYIDYYQTVIKQLRKRAFPFN